jgi:hypothetical protein
MMAPNFYPAVLFNPFMIWADVAMKTAEMLLSSSQVMGSRVDDITRAGASPSASPQDAFTLMSTEMQRAWQRWFTYIGPLTALASASSPGETTSENSTELALAALKPEPVRAHAKRSRRVSRTRVAAKRSRRAS